MLKIGSTTYRIQHSRDRERILLTVWRNGRLTEHKFHAGQMFYVSEFIDPHGSYHLAS